MSDPRMTVDEAKAFLASVSKKTKQAPEPEHGEKAYDFVCKSDEDFIDVAQRIKGFMADVAKKDNHGDA